MPDPLDAIWRGSFRIAHRLARVWWALRRPEAHGAFVAVWCEGRLLLVRNSYRPGESVPAGRIRRGEAPAEGAARELREEVGLAVCVTDLEPAGVYRVAFEGKQDHAHFFEWRAPPGVEPRIDRREVVHAEWVPEAELTRRALLPQTRAYLEARAEGARQRARSG